MFVLRILKNRSIDSTKLFLVAFAVIAAVAADVSHLPSNEYLPPVVQEAQIAVAPSNEYLPPVQAEAAPAHELADDGYRYKTHKRVVVRRHRRDVNELPSTEYLPSVAAPSNEYLAPVEAAPETILADDGYRYKTHKRVVVRRHRRDVNELSSEYLPPFQAAAPSNEYLPPSEEVVAAPETILADDGYRYKTHKRVVVRRHRRDVNELPSNEYLPPVDAPSNEYLAPVEAAPETVLADDGYRYKTHKRVVVRRHRRDVNELSSEYLPPFQAAAPSNEYLPPSEEVVAAPETILADDGYRYKTHKRVVVRRHRRDVSHLPSNEYLPPVQAAAPSNEYLPPVQVAAPAPVQIAAPAPVQYAAPAPAPVQIAAPAPVQIAAPAPAPVEAAPAHELAADGYRYKTHRRVVYRRHRRDVNELPSNEYLPPVAATSNEYLAPVEAAPETILADDGYRYKTHKRVVVRRHRRDVNELPSNEYLPPGAAPSNEYLAPVENTVEVAPAHVLADDGYRYKTHKRVVVRRH
ncbi:uncharacterized protein Dana_GF25078 [Drosophila ananassae]|uniref:Uncharacterized protein n=1 Tax=Drosophila ananassae TaxID=7217 RepID=B3M935_DROAN|nr:uncharacterized protein Dana_GF25078 [Drosophila ananassae]